MGDIYVVVEHRQGKIREVTLEMLSAAASLAEQTNGEAVAVLLGSENDTFANDLAGYCDKIISIDDNYFENYNSEYYQKAIVSLVKQNTPYLIMVGHTAQGVDFAPNVAVELKMPFVTDVVGMEIQGGQLKVTRQYYQGKVNADFEFKGDPPFLVTVRESSFGIEDLSKQAVIETIESPVKEDVSYRKFVEYLEAEAGKLDITKSEILIGVGRGIQEEENIEMIQKLADVIKADICGSRVAVDSGWIDKELQVGISGKRVKPKLYIAIGISGAFQHLVGMSGANTIVAINKDPDAPIFTVANYAIVDDLFEVVPKLTDKFKELLG